MRVGSTNSQRWQKRLGLLFAVGLLGVGCSSGEPGASSSRPVGRGALPSCAPGTITTVAGTGRYGDSGDGGPATKAELARPYAVAADAHGNVYIGEFGSYGSSGGGDRVRMVSEDGIITTVAGTGKPGYSGDGGPATEARLDTSTGLVVDQAGNLYIADSGNHVVRKVDSSGVITTVAGTGKPGYSGDGGPARRARMDRPENLLLRSDGTLYVTDTLNMTVRRIDATGTITTVAGTGKPGYSGDGGPATKAQLYEPHDVELDEAGNAYIADTFNHRVRVIGQGGLITTYAGTGQPGVVGEVGGPATSADIGFPAGLAVDGDGGLYISDNSHRQVVKVDKDGTISLFAGSGSFGNSGDGGPATDAEFAHLVGLAFDPDGNLYIADRDNNNIRKVCS